MDRYTPLLRRADILIQRYETTIPHIKATFTTVKINTQVISTQTVSRAI